MDQPKNPDRHRYPVVVTRVEPELKAAAQRTFEDRGWTVSDFLAACLKLGVSNPDAMLRRLAQFRPPQRRGRPPGSG